MPDKYDLQKPSGKSSPRKDASRTTQPKIEWRGYINIPLVEADKRHYFQWRGQPDIVDEIKDAVLRDGFKLSVDFQPREAAFRASLYCQNAELPEAGYCLSLYASSPAEAEMRLLYVHAVKARQDWQQWIGRKNRDDDWEQFRD